MKRKTKTTEQYIQEAIQVHGNKYDYSKVIYEHSEKKICIVCPKHGEFLQRASSHLSGRGCPKCGTEQGSKLKSKTIDQFISDAIRVHGNKYDYSQSEYINAYTKVKIICPEHGEFWQVPNSHLKGRGCPKCKKSHGEEFIENWLKNNNIEYINSYRIILPTIARNTNIIFVDFYIESKNTIIEYNGKQHYIPIKYFGGDINFQKQQNRDNVLEQYCKNNSIQLINIEYDKSKEEVVKCLEKYLL